jgi:thioredoxin reductase (NADPH)
MRPLKNLSEIAVIGGGLAGLAAARHAARLGRLVTLFEGSGLWGGQLATVGHVDGLMMQGSHSGQDLAIPLIDDIRKAAVRVIESAVVRVEADDALTLETEDGATHRPEVVIVAAGATLRRLGVPGEEDFHGRGVSRCASCDGGFFRNAHVAVIGGGDAAFHEALLLSRTSSRVTMVCRSPVRAKRDYVDRLSAQENVAFLWDSEVAEILGDQGGVTGLALRDTRTGASSTLDCAGVFPFVGVAPATNFLPERLRRPDGLVETDTGFASSDPRILAIGAARADYGGNVLQAMAEGVGAAEAAAKRLVTKERG